MVQALAGGGPVRLSPSHDWAVREGSSCFRSRGCTRLIGSAYRVDQCSVQADLTGWRVTGSMWAQGAGTRRLTLRFPHLELCVPIWHTLCCVSPPLDKKQSPLLNNRV